MRSKSCGTTECVLRCRALATCAACILACPDNEPHPRPSATPQVASADAVVSPDLPLRIDIACDPTAGTISFTDTGVGMTKEELVDNLGTIARSGSRAFLTRLRAEGGPQAAGGDAGSIIGQFGVGFYSAFMVAHLDGAVDGGGAPVTVFSRSATPGEDAHVWSSAGDGSYTVRRAEGAPRGTTVVVRLKPECREFAVAATVRDVVARYSSFVAFPIAVDGKVVNTVAAIWGRPRAEVTPAEYAAFYRFKSGDFEPPRYTLHFAADAPLSLRALLFVGASHDEKYGMGRIKVRAGVVGGAAVREARARGGDTRRRRRRVPRAPPQPGVDLYSRRVLIEAGSRVMPDWLRFVHGVVDRCAAAPALRGTPRHPRILPAPLASSATAATTCR